MGRAVGAGIAFAAAAASGVIAAFAAASRSWGLWVAIGVLVVGGAALQGLVTAGEKRSRGRVLASGDGSVAVAGSASGISTHVENIVVENTVVPGAAEQAEVTAAGRGSVSVGGDAAEQITTDVTGGESPAGP